MLIPTCWSNLLTTRSFSHVVTTCERHVWINMWSCQHVDTNVLAECVAHHMLTTCKDNTFFFTCGDNVWANIRDQHVEFHMLVCSLHVAPHVGTLQTGVHKLTHYFILFLWSQSVVGALWRHLRVVIKNLNLKWTCFLRLLVVISECGCLCVKLSDINVVGYIMHYL
jgi:hypothetical protein